MAVVFMYEPGMQRLEGITNDQAYEITKEIAQEIRQNVHFDEGDLRRSVRARKLARSSRVYIGTDHWYFHEYGVKPHRIRVKTAKVLANWKTRQTFGRAVNHPGHRAYRPIRRAFYKKRVMKGSAL